MHCAIRVSFYFEQTGETTGNNNYASYTSCILSLIYCKSDNEWGFGSTNIYPILSDIISNLMKGGPVKCVFTCLAWKIIKIIKVSFIKTILNTSSPTPCDNI